MKKLPALSPLKIKLELTVELPQEAAGMPPVDRRLYAAQQIQAALAEMGAGPLAAFRIESCQITVSDSRELTFLKIPI